MWRWMTRHWKQKKNTVVIFLIKRALKGRDITYYPTHMDDEWEILYIDHEAWQHIKNALNFNKKYLTEYLPYSLFPTIEYVKFKFGYFYVVIAVPFQVQIIHERRFNEHITTYFKIFIPNEPFRTYFHNLLCMCHIIKIYMIETWKTWIFT